jgi:hypothetical protein
MFYMSKYLIRIKIDFPRLENNGSISIRLFKDNVPSIQLLTAARDRRRAGEQANGHSQQEAGR